MNSVIQSSIDKTKANFEKNKELSNLLDEIRKKCTKEITALLGSKANEYREFHEKRREITIIMQPFFTATPEGRKAKSQFQKTQLYEANKFIEGLGISVRDLKSIHSKYQEESKSIIEKTRNVEGLSNLDVGPIPPDVVDPDPDSQWQSFHPPYLSGTSFGEAYAVHSGDADGFVPYTSHYENHLTGDISCITQNVIYHAGDHAYRQTVGRSFIWMNFQMPELGRVDIWTQVYCAESSYAGSLSNWFGFSDATTEQSSVYFMAVGESPEGKEVHYMLQDEHRHTDEDVEWSLNMVMPGEYRTYHLVSDLYYSAGQWVPIKAGILDVQDGVCDDMSFFGEIKNRWILLGFWVSPFNP